MSAEAHKQEAERLLDAVKLDDLPFGHLSQHQHMQMASIHTRLAGLPESRIVVGSLQKAPGAPSADHFTRALDLLESFVDGESRKWDHRGGCANHYGELAPGQCSDKEARRLLDELRPGWDQV